MFLDHFDGKGSSPSRGSPGNDEGLLFLFLTDKVQDIVYCFLVQDIVYNRSLKIE